ncbi:glycosyltransferase family 29 protein [Thermodesulfobacteriota bacterium]
MSFHRKEFIEAFNFYTKAIDNLPCIGEWYKDRGNCRRQLGRYDNDTLNNFLTGIEKVRYRKSECIGEYLNYLWETKGLTSDILKKHEQIIQTESNKKSSSDFLAKYAAMFSDAGDHEKAIKYYFKAKSLKKSSVEKYPSLINTVASINPEEENKKNQNLQFYRYLKTSEGTLEKLLKKYDNSVAVVGNSPKELGKGKGNVIDQHALVVRFNDYSINPPYDVDYGSKANIWVRSIGDWVPQRNIGKYELIMVSGLNLAHRYGEWRTIKSYALHAKPIELFPKEQQYELIEKLHAVPTAGISFCYMLYKIMGPLNPDSMFGFSFTDHIGENAVPSHYYDSRPPSERHNWYAERALFHQLLK